jgi:hypothetical protein
MRSHILSGYRSAARAGGGSGSIAPSTPGDIVDYLAHQVDDVRVQGNADTFETVDLCLQLVHPVLGAI